MQIILTTQYIVFSDSVVILTHNSLISNKPHKISTIKVHVRPIVGWIASFLVFSYTISFFIIIP